MDLGQASVAASISCLKYSKMTVSLKPLCMLVEAFLSLSQASGFYKIGPSPPRTKKTKEKSQRMFSRYKKEEELWAIPFFSLNDKITK